VLAIQGSLPLTSPDVRDRQPSLSVAAHVNMRNALFLRTVEAFNDKRIACS
jgi:hypothetical protein